MTAGMVIVVCVLGFPISVAIAIGIVVIIYRTLM